MGLLKGDDSESVFTLTAEEKETWNALQASLQDRDHVLSLLRDLRTERQLEFQIYSSREQWFWIPWTVLLAGTLASIASASTIPGVVAPPLTGLTAALIWLQRQAGLTASLRALNQRHKWTYWLTNKDAAHPAAKLFGFEFRSLYGDDPLHMVGFAYPVKMKWFTAFVWTALWLIGIVRYWNSAESWPVKQWLGWG